MPASGRFKWHRGLVHITTNPDFARFFAACAPGGGRGDLYEVDVDRSTLRPDLDIADRPWGKGAFVVPEARIVRVVERALAEPPAVYSRWPWTVALDDGRRREPAPGLFAMTASGDLAYVNAGQLVRIGPALPHACSSCPWRPDNDGKALPDNSRWKPTGYEPRHTAENRRRMWDNHDGRSLGDGTFMFCHQTAACDTPGHITDNAQMHRCAGAEALQHRAVIRAWTTHNLHPLKSWNAARRIVASMLGIWPPERITTENGWFLNSVKVTFEQLLAAAHPAILDPEIASEQVPPPTGDELQAWRQTSTFERLLACVLEASMSATSTIHGVDHWRRVARTGTALAEQTPGADTEIVHLFSLFHDSMRHNDGHDPGHGSRGAEHAQSLRADLPLDDERFETLTLACRDHTAGRVTDDPTIGVCWDADRLDLGRVGVKPRPELLSTQAARNGTRFL